MWWSLVRHITGQYVKVKIDDEDTDEQSNDKEHAIITAIKTVPMMQNTLGLSMFQ